ncbi:PAS domain S-box protein [Candidatus Lokiarchaeum ossiferum]|uniref:PAS domain S-box protein n=1 Tax=Candidatus Lokiarchaeum ossiferum TaxID=2951803 RepID=UPI00352C27E5
MSETEKQTKKKGSSKDFRILFEQLPFPIAISDNEDRNLYVNPKFTHIFGYTIEDIPTTDHWSNLAYPDELYRAKIKKNAPEISNTISDQRISSVTCKDGTVKQVTFQDVNITDHEFITIFEDVTEQLQNQKTAKKYQQRFDKIVELIPFPIGISDDKGNLVYLNEAFIETLGYDLQDIPTEQKWMELAYPNNEYRRTIPTEGNYQNTDFSASRIREVTCKDGSHKIIVFRDVKIEDGYEVTVGYDITEQKKIEQIIRDQQKEFRAIVEDASDMIIRVDMKRIITSINPACAKILGYSFNEMIGHDFRDFVPTEFHPIMDMHGDKKIFGNSQSTLYEIELLKKDETTILVEMNSRILKRDGEPIGIQAIVRDITERKKIDEERIRQQKLESINLLAGGIAHDYNNILVAILGNINLLQLEELNSEQNDILADLEQGTLRARDLTKQLLTFSKGGVPQKIFANITDIIEESVSFVLRGSKSRHESHHDENLPQVEVDASQISQVLNNLVINADQSMPRGGIIKTYASEIILKNQSSIPLPDGKYIQIAISDTGTGIPKEIQHKIFEPYFTTKNNGNGLGLANSYSIISKHEGFMTFSSQLNVGTTFYIYLPVSKNEDSSQQIKNKPNESEIKGKVILLDDDQTIHRFYDRFLKKTEIQFESYYSGNSFLQKLESMELPLKKTLIIMDLTIPGGIGGREVIKVYRKLDKITPIIVSSGYENDPFVANFEEYGFTDILIKPYSISQLKLIIEKYI